MIITFSGTPGSGKSTVAEMVSKKIKYSLFSAGDFRRNMARKKKITLSELNKIGEQNSKTDSEVDNYQKELATKKDNLVVVGRTSFHFIPWSVKFYLDANLDERAKRIYKDKRREESASSLSEAKEIIKQREESDKRRYGKYYGFNCYDKKNYDFVIDTTKITAKKVADGIIKQIKKIKNIASAGFIIFDNKKRFLLIFQKRGKFWEFPKGKLEKNETVKSAAKRELAEETGIINFKIMKGFKTENSYTFKDKGDFFVKKVNYYLAKTSDKIKLSNEHTGFFWLPYKRAESLLKYDNQKEILKKANQFLK